MKYEIDEEDSRAICEEMGERLRVALYASGVGRS
jgi:hypothetical protein